MNHSVAFTDAQWAFISPLLPPPAPTGRPRADDRKTMEGILYVLRTGCRWQDLPRSYGAPVTVWRRLKWWGTLGVWERLWRAMLAALDQQGRLEWSQGCLDGSFVPAKKRGAGVGLTKKGKGTKWMVVVDGNGMPLGYHLAGAHEAEVALAQATLDSVHVQRPRGRPKQRLKLLIADRAYDSRAFRQVLYRRGIRACIPPRRRPKTWRAKRGRPIRASSAEYAQRWKVERTFAWLGTYRRLLIRWESLFVVYRSFFLYALLTICLQRLIPRGEARHARAQLARVA